MSLYPIECVSRFGTIFHFPHLSLGPPLLQFDDLGFASLVPLLGGRSNLTPGGHGVDHEMATSLRVR